MVCEPGGIMVSDAPAVSAQLHQMQVGRIGGAGRREDNARCPGVHGDTGQQLAAAGEGDRLGQVVGAKHIQRIQPGFSEGIGEEYDPVAAPVFALRPAQIQRGIDSRIPQAGPDAVVGQAAGRLVLFQDIEVRLPQHHQSLALAADGEQAPAIGRPRNGGGVGKSLGPKFGIIQFLSVVQVKDVNLAGGGYVAGAGTPGYEGDTAAVGRPGRGDVIPVAISDLRGVGGAYVDEEQMEMIVAAPADGVVAVAYAPDRPFFWLVLRWLVLGGVGVAVMVGDNVGDHRKPG